MLKELTKGEVEKLPPQSTKDNKSPGMEEKKNRGRGSYRSWPLHGCSQGSEILHPPHIR